MCPPRAQGNYLAIRRAPRRSPSSQSFRVIPQERFQNLKSVSWNLDSGSCGGFEHHATEKHQSQPYSQSIQCAGTSASCLRTANMIATKVTAMIGPHTHTHAWKMTFLAGRQALPCRCRLFRGGVRFRRMTWQISAWPTDKTARRCSVQCGSEATNRQ